MNAIKYFKKKIGIQPSQTQIELIKRFKTTGNLKIRVVGRGGLVKPIESLHESENYSKPFEAAVERMKAKA